jgi:hypothetical protein
VIFNAVAFAPSGSSEDSIGSLSVTRMPVSVRSTLSISAFKAAPANAPSSLGQLDVVWSAVIGLSHQCDFSVASANNSAGQRIRHRGPPDAKASG